jgi:hypothetical protein
MTSLTVNPTAINLVDFALADPAVPNSHGIA